ncbi:MAG: hypothetical protein KC729_01490 [Candidatus Eisenbacteria bacterium]|uniref:Glycosyltransferase RgtA/B/C/D-like domain-containing protein n=1 Tax=Eiseniibacteriota bacterium TaxID=2212470 RepID=A0A956RMD8_UNCEI|nr:hypothetical protein [Candidatus Eisenbacteria bacterium]
MAAVLALLATVPALFGSDDLLYPVRSDSEKYHNMGRGLALFFEELPAATSKMVRGEFSDEDRIRYGMDGPILQHAASYITLLGSTYVMSGGSESSGRWLTVLLFAGAAALLALWTGRHFGALASFAVIPLFVFWPAHLYYGTAIMTEVPMIFFMIAAAVALDLTRDGSSRLRPAVGGVFLALLYLAKITFRLVTLPILALDLWTAWTRPRPAWLRLAGARVAGVLLLLLVWGVFLWMAGLPDNPVAASGEQELWIFRGNYVADHGFETVGLGDVAQPELLEAIRETRDRNLPDDEQQKVIFKKAFLLTVKKQPVRWAALVASKVRWFWIYPAVKEDVHAWWGRMPPPAHLQPVVVMLALVGLAASFRRRPSAWIPALLAAYLCAVHATTHLVSRYDIPAVALSMPYAVFGTLQLGAALRWLGRSRIWAKGGAPGDAWLRVGVMAALMLGLLSILLTRDQLASWGLSVRTACIIVSWLGALAILIWVLPVRTGLRRAGWSRTLAFVGPMLVFGLPALTYLAVRHIDYDPDVWKTRLQEPGDRIVQRILLPPGMEWRPVRAAEIQIDMLASASRSQNLIVRVNGRDICRYEGNLVSNGENFWVDRNIHAVQDRYARVQETLADHLDGFVHARHPGAGYEYYRQWFRVPVPIDLLEGRDAVEVELTWDGGDGWIDVYGDTGVSRGERSRILFAPAFFTNPYELSSYQFQLFASDREKADARMIRPLKLLSPGTEAHFFRGGIDHRDDLSPTRGLQRGEFRIRLRTQLHGGYVSRPDPKDPTKKKPVWAVFPKEDDDITDSDTIRLLAARRDSYVDGWQTY